MFIHLLNQLLTGPYYRRYLFKRRREGRARVSPFNQLINSHALINFKVVICVTRRCADELPLNLARGFLMDKAVPPRNPDLRQYSLGGPSLSCVFCSGPYFARDPLFSSYCSLEAFSDLLASEVGF